MENIDDNREIILHGIGASPGVCIGHAYIVDTEGVDVVRKYHIDSACLKNEKNRFKSAAKKAKNELRAIIESTPEDLRQHTNILETHMVLMKDKMLYGKIIEAIEKEQINAEWALKKVVANVQATFKNLDDSYFKERASDVGHVSDRIMRNLVGMDQVNIKDINKRVILIARDLSPAETSQIQLERIKGFVTDRGGMASHTSIIARTLEIPAVLGLDNATSIIKNDDLIIVDGAFGEVVVHPAEQTLEQYYNRKISYEKHKAVITQSGHFTAETSDGFHLKVMGNIELPEEVVTAVNYGSDGIGLYRTEFQYLSRPNFPGENELFDKYKDVVEIMAPKPVTIRTLDINGDKAVAYTSDAEEANPALGLRAIRYCLKKPDVFNTQLRAILRASAFGNVRVLFPMISTYDEIIEAKKILNKAADALYNEGINFNENIEIGIMIEVPAAAIMADVMAKEVDFFSIGTNDLIQYALAVDRGNKDVAHLYQPLDPAIIRMIKRVADAAKANGIKAFMCGEMAGDPINAPVLLGLGIDELSMNPQTIPIVKSMIRSLKIGDARLFVKDLLKQASAKEVIKLVQDRYGGILSEKVYKK